MTYFLNRLFTPHDNKICTGYVLMNLCKKQLYIVISLSKHCASVALICNRQIDTNVTHDFCFKNMQNLLLQLKYVSSEFSVHLLDTLWRQRSNLVSLGVAEMDIMATSGRSHITTATSLKFLTKIAIAVAV